MQSFLSDNLFSLSCRWSIGYTGSPIFFTDETTIAHLSGNCIRFVNIITKEESFLESPGDGIEVFAVNTGYNAIAFSEVCTDTNIYIYDFLNLTEPKTILQG